MAFGESATGFCGFILGVSKASFLPSSLHSPHGRGACRMQILVGRKVSNTMQSTSNLRNFDRRRGRVKGGKEGTWLRGAACTDLNVNSPQKVDTLAACSNISLVLDANMMILHLMNSFQNVSDICLPFIFTNSPLMFLLCLSISLRLYSTLQKMNRLGHILLAVSRSGAFVIITPRGNFPLESS